MSNTAFDVDTSVLNELDFPVMCECLNPVDLSPCQNEAKYKATLFHSSTGCRKRLMIICQQHLDRFLEFERLLKKPGHYCAVCRTKDPTIVNLTTL